MARNRRRSSSKWQEIISAQESSGLDVKTFCEAESIGKASFYQWRRRLCEAPATKPVEMQREGFIEMGQLGPVVTEQTGDEMPLQIGLELGGGITLTIRRG